MAHPRSFLLLLLLALLGGLGAWLVFGPARHGIADGDRAARLPDPEPSASATLAASDVPEVVVRLTERARLLELAPPPSLRVMSGDVALAARVSWLAGAAAVPRAERATGMHLVAVDLPGEERSHHVLRLRDEAAEAQLELGPPRTYAGHVVDAEGRGIAGARVWMEGRAEVETDAQGDFAVSGLRGRFGVPLVIRAAGRADHFRIVDLDGAADAAPPVFALGDGAELVVRLAAPRPSGAARVYLRPLGSVETAELSVRHYPFFWPVIAGAEPLAEGACRLAGLPRGARVEVVVQHDAFAVAPPVAIHLRDATQTVTVQKSVAPLVRGEVLRAGAPVPGVLVVCATGRAPSLPHRDELLAPAAELAGVAHARTDAAGAFAVARPNPAGALFVAVLPAGPLGLWRQITPAQSGDPQRFDLPDVDPAAAAGKPALRLRTDRPVRVIVERGASREPAADLSANGDLLVPLVAPACLDVEVRTPQGTRTEPALAVRGVVDVWL